MPNFKKMHQFVAFVNRYNTKDNEEDDATLNNLADRNYHINKAIKEDNALRKFKDKYKYDSVEVAQIYTDAKELGFVERIDNTVQPHLAGICILVTFKGKEFIHESKILKLKTGRFDAWLQYHDKKLILLVAFVGSVILGNFEYVINFFRWALSLFTAR